MVYEIEYCSLYNECDLSVTKYGWKAWFLHSVLLHFRR
jgi:hypothetical protein